MPTELKRRSARRRRNTSRDEPVRSSQPSRMLAAAACVEGVGHAQIAVGRAIPRAMVSRKTLYRIFAELKDYFCAVFEQAYDRARPRARQSAGASDQGLTSGLIGRLMRLEPLESSQSEGGANEWHPWRP